jgi:triphosphoribosyl-dephospho-CoA synthase
MDTDDVTRAAQLASALEVSGYPKPGNVHRTADLEEATFEQFMSSAIAIGGAISDVSRRGLRAGRRKIGFSGVGVGAAIKRAVEDTMRWQRDGNTNLGVVMLLVPLAAAAGVTLGKKERFAVGKLRKNLSSVLKSTTPEDALGLYDAISIANPGGLGNVTELDAGDKRSKKRIKKEKIPLYKIMEMSAGWDNIAREWTTDMQVTFEVGHPLIKMIHRKSKNMNTTTVQTFLEILSRYPDTLVQRTHGARVAREVSAKAAAILKRGGAMTARGWKLLERFDDEFRKKGINPGTAADLTASSLMVSILDGLRP